MKGALCVLAAWCCVAPAMAADAGTPAAHQRLILFTERPGSCTLAVAPDGSARLGYGAAPWSVRVAPGTFRFDDLMTWFGAHVAQTEKAGDDPHTLASFLLPGSSTPQTFQDADFMRGLFYKAWQARLSADPHGMHNRPEDHARIKSACAFS
ncbi:hypothetical protein [Acidovorax sp.]|uniref:hypothetical protein n=1 Tax=Acidovorax sp. TaxID=1872122 RepID=UPI00391C1980